MFEALAYGLSLAWNWVSGLPAIFLYGLLTLAVYAVNAWAAKDSNPRYADAYGVSLLLCVSFLASNITVTLFGWPDAIIFFPILDAGFCWLLWRAWKQSRKGWMAAVMFLVCIQLAMHVSALYAWKMGVLTNGALRTYGAGLNGIYVLIALTVGGVGCAHAIRRLRDSRLSDRRSPAPAHGVR